MKLNNLIKPSIKSEWRGQRGSKFRVWVVITHDGTRYVRSFKEDATRQYNASLRFYKKLKERGKK